MRRLCSFLAAAFILCGFGLYSDNGTVIEYPFTFSGVVEYPRPGAPLACWDFETAVAGTYTDDCAATYQMTVNGAPTRVDDATWPAGFAGAQGMAWSFGGADDLTRSDDDSFDFGSTPFSIQMAITPHAVTGTQYLLAKWHASATNRSWTVLLLNDGVVFYIDRDGDGGAGMAFLLKASSVALHRPAFITIAYDPTPGDGSAEARVYVDNLSTATSSAFPAPPHNTGMGFAVASHSIGGQNFTGLVHFVSIYSGVFLTEADHDDAFSRWQGRSSTAGDSVRATVTSAAPPAILQTYPTSGTEPFLIDQPANSYSVGTPVANSGGIYSAAAISNLCFRSSLETWAAGAPTGWTETIGGGTSDGTQNTTNMAHNGSSAQMFCDGVNNLTLDSGCTALAAATTYYLSGYFQTTTGVANFSLQLIEYTDAACAVGAVTTTVYNGDPGANWVKQGGTRTTGGAVQSGQVRLLIQTNNATVLADAIQLRAANAPTDAFCSTDADAAAVCNHVLVEAISPVSANGTLQVDATWRSPFDGTTVGGNTWFFVDGNATAANTYGAYIAAGTDEPQWGVWDAVPATLYIAPNVLNWAADTDYAIRMYADGSGNLGMYWNAAWDETEAGVGTGMRTAAQTTMRVGSHQTIAYDFWTRDLVIFRRLHP